MERSTSCTQSSHFIPIIINGTLIKKTQWFEFTRLISSNNMECSFHSTAKRQTFIHSWIFYFNNKQTEIWAESTKNFALSTKKLFPDINFHHPSIQPPDNFFHYSRLLITTSNDYTSFPNIYMSKVNICDSSI